MAYNQILALGGILAAFCLSGAALVVLLYRDGYFPLSWLPV